MNLNKLPRWGFVLFLVLIFLTAIFAFAATNSVPITRLMDQSFSISVSDLAPSACDSISAGLTSIVVCEDEKGGKDGKGKKGEKCKGTNGNDLILGTLNENDIDGRKGNDCILGGAGDDNPIDGGEGTDICIGGPGDDIFNNCETEIQ